MVNKELNETLRQIAKSASGTGTLFVALDALEAVNEALQKGIYGEPVLQTEIYGEHVDTLLIVTEKKL